MYMEDLVGKFINEFYIVNTLVTKMRRVEVKSEIRVIIDCFQSPLADAISKAISVGWTSRPK